MNSLPWHHRWNVLALTMLSQILVAGIGFCFPFWVVPWGEEFHASHSQLMLVISVSTLVMGFASPVAGTFYDRYPAQRIHGFGVVVYGLLFVAMSFATNQWAILFCYGLLLPVGTVLTAHLFAQIMVARWFEENRGLATGISALGVSLGAFIMPPLATALLAHFDWHTVFRIMGGLTLLILIPCGQLALRRKPDTIPSSTSSHLADPTVTHLTTASLLRNRDFWLIAAGFGFILFACLPVQFGVGSYAKDLGITQQQASFAAALSAISFAAGKIGFGKLADMLPHRVSYWIAVLFIMSGNGIYSSAGSLPALTIGLMLMTCGLGCVMPISSGMVISRFGLPSFGRVLGLLWLFIGMGSVSPYIAGLIRDATGSYSTAFMLLTLPLLLTSLAMRSLSQQRNAA